MIYITYYISPIGKILLASKEEKLIGLWFEQQKYYFESVKEDVEEQPNLEIFKKAKEWLTRYFQGEKTSSYELELNPKGTEFQKSVWKILMDIPYGQTITYKEIACKIVQERRLQGMSAQAVGNAVAHNPISIIIPCHRVIGTSGKLTGYAGGLEKKEYLLKWERGIK